MLVVADAGPLIALTQLRLSIAGTVGVLLRAKQRGLVPAVRPLLDRLRTEGFRMRNELYARALALAGETP